MFELLLLFINFIVVYTPCIHVSIHRASKIGHSINDCYNFDKVWTDFKNSFACRSYTGNFDLSSMQLNCIVSLRYFVEIQHLFQVRLTSLFGRHDYEVLRNI